MDESKPPQQSEFSVPLAVVTLPLGAALFAGLGAFIHPLVAGLGGFTGVVIAANITPPFAKLRLPL